MKSIRDSRWRVTPPTVLSNPEIACSDSSNRASIALALERLPAKWNEFCNSLTNSARVRLPPTAAISSASVVKRDHKFRASFASLRLSALNDWSRISSLVEDASELKSNCKIWARLSKLQSVSSSSANPASARLARKTSTKLRIAIFAAPGRSNLARKATASSMFRAHFRTS